MHYLVTLVVFFTLLNVGIYLFIVAGLPLLFILIRFLLICAAEAALLVLRGLWVTLRITFTVVLPAVFSASRKAALFATIFWQEWRHPGAFADDEDDDDEDAEAQRTPEQLFQDALTLLGLGPHFTQADLKRAFKRAMLQAHPDRGGSADQAVAVNVARDLINAEMGWS